MNTIRPTIAATAALLVLGVLSVVSLCAPLLTSFDPATADATSIALHPGVQGHLLGTDALGRDVLSRILHGGRLSLALGFIATLIALLLGVAVGMLAAMGGTVADVLLMRGVDLVLTVPTFVVLVSLRSVFVPGFWTLTVLIALFSWTSIARVARAELGRLAMSPMAVAAVAAGVSRPVIAIRHLLPHALPPILAVTGEVAAGAILTEAALGFLRLGITDSASSWGNILSSAADAVVLGQWWVVVFPAVAIALAAAAFNALADAISER